MGDLTKAVAARTRAKAKPGNVRILTFDIETYPTEAYVWSLWKQNVSISQIVRPGGVFSFAAKWVGEKDVMFFSDYHDGHDVMVQALHRLFSEADIVIGYNSTSFDVPRVQTEFMLAGLPPAKPFKQIDLLRVIRKQFAFASNKLDFVSQQLGIGHKTHHAGFDLWVKCMAGDEAAWKKMRTYNMQDVRLTEKLYFYLLPWLTQVPHLGQMDGNEHSCPYCGGVKLRRDGTAHAFVTSYRLYECLNCHAWVRGTAKLQDATRTRAQKIN